MWEYKVVAAPKQPARRRDAGVKDLADRFAFGIETEINEMAAQGWEYQRSDVLPCEERTGLTGRNQSFQTLLIFRRVRVETEVLPQSPAVAAAPAITAEPDETPEPETSDKGDGEGVDAPDDVRP